MHAAKPVPPNIVFVMADHLGVGWIVFDDRRPELQTPNLARMARAGMVFTKAYAATPVCSPTRAVCITGMSPAKANYTTHTPGMGAARYCRCDGFKTLAFR